jgi:hypothetical protein
VGKEGQRTVNVPIVTVLLTIVSNAVILALTLYFQSRREQAQFDRAQLAARLERVQAAYRLALQGDQALLDAVNAALDLIDANEGSDEQPWQQEAKQTAQAEGAREMLNRAWIELTLENVSLEAIDLSTEIFRAYSQVRVHIIVRSHVGGSPLSFEERVALTADFLALVRNRRQAIQAHLAELEVPAPQARWWRRGAALTSHKRTQENRDAAPTT